MLLEEELAKQKEELGDLEHDRSIELQKDALDTEYDEYEKYIDSKITALEQYLKETGTLTRDAIALLSSRSGEFYQSLLEWNRQFGSGVDQDIVGAWQRAFNAMEAYRLAAEQVGAGGTGARTPTVAPRLPTDQGDLTGKRIKLDDPYSDVVRVYTSSDASSGTSMAEGRYYTIKDYDEGAVAPYKISGLGADGNLVEGWIKSRNALFSMFHSGLDAGPVGGLKTPYGEQFAKLLKGEFVVNEGQMKDYITRIFPKSVEAVASSGGGINIGNLMEFHVSGNADESIIPDIERIANRAVEKLVEITRKRGNFRNANSYSI